MRQRVSRRSGGALVLALLLACGTEEEKFSLPPNTEGWWRDRVVYQVFVRSFADSDGDGHGDLAGLTARLDHLNDGDPATETDLGVEAIWLMPIFASPSYHGYDVTDYRAIQPDYGSLADFDAFVAAARARGIRVILDLVLNHSSSSHPWFLDARGSPSAAKRDWYVWRTTDPGWTQPWNGVVRTWHPMSGAYYYGVFWSGMPDLNLANAAVEAELVDTMRFWLARGVDGFRLDAARYLLETDAGQADLPETHAFLKRLRVALQRDSPDALLVGEVWTGLETVATYYGQGDELQLAFSFDLAEALKGSVRDGDAAGFASTLVRVGDALRGKDRGFDAPFLSNHDQQRALRAMGGEPAAARVAAATLLALPGTPFVYYGEELGMQGTAATADEDKRAPMRWTADAPGYGFTTGVPWRSVTEAAGVDVATQQADPGSLFHLYRRLIALRAAHPELEEGSLTWLQPTGGGAGVLAFVRALGGERVLLVANYATAATGPFTLPVTGAPSLLLQDGSGSLPVPSGAGLEVADLGPRAALLVSLD